MEKLTKGLVLKLIDYKEADKLASIFSYDQGIILAKFSGVKKDKARYKAVAQPFTLAEFLFSEPKHKLVIGADIIDTFPQILSSYSKTICAYIILDIIKSVLPEEKPEPELFLLTINALKDVETKDELIFLAKYILNFISLLGLQPEYKEQDIVYLDLANGNFVCDKTDYCVLIDKNVGNFLQKLSVLEKLELLEVENFKDVSSETKKQTICLLNRILTIKFGNKIKSFALL